MLENQRLKLNENLPTFNALTVGTLMGALGGLLALLLILEGPVIALGLVIAAMIGLVALSSLDASLALVLILTGLLPFGTLPFKVAITPSLIDAALGVFIVVYLFQWMTGRRRDLQTTPVHGMILLFILMMAFAFVLGMPNGTLTPGILRRFLGLMANVALSLVLVDVVRRVETLRRLTLTFMVIGAVAGVIGSILWVLNDDTANTILNRLVRIGYPAGNVLRYREDGVQIKGERAIGTWVDPNAYGGFLMMVGALIAPQLLARRPLTGHRWIMFVLMGCVGAGLFLSDSRGSMLGLLTGVGLVAVIRYRSLVWVLLILIAIAPFNPITAGYVDRVIAGVTASDLETQMRLGEYKDTFILIARYPVFGVGFIAPPDIDLYQAVANTYLTIASNSGIVGLVVYLITLLSVFGYGYRHRAEIDQNNKINDIWLGLFAGVVAAMVGGMFDHFYFNIEYQATSLTVWFFVGLLLAATRLAIPINPDKVLGLPRVPKLQRVEPASD
ncbi:MAG: O-antigen polymerase [Chloroflexota bacterium]|nr:O-antigen ligase domain-containing protein [Chloroflexota bacterium]NOG62548.1 O-antigen ligase family protein [Chloroflexota bacterium]GIK64242.1 MAG: O-antigen polymerase [Chloroflexota bacterium]